MFMSMKPQPSPLSGVQLVDEYFIENRNRLIEVAAFLDRLDRTDATVARKDFRVQALAGAIRVLGTDSPNRVRDIQVLMSDPRTEPLAALDRKGAVGAYDRSATEVR
jgi:hypothetical protein